MFLRLVLGRSLSCRRPDISIRLCFPRPVRIVLDPKSSSLSHLLTRGIRSMLGLPGEAQIASARDVRVNYLLTFFVARYRM